MRVLITGAGGFVGSHLAVAMARSRRDVIALARHPRSTILETQKLIRVEQADLAVETSTGRRTIRNTDTSGQVLKIVGPLDGPRVTREKSAPRQPAD